MEAILVVVSGYMIGLAGVVWAGALLVGQWYAVHSAQRSGLNANSMYWFGFCAILGGLWGGHFLGLMVHGTNGDPLAWLKVWIGGKTYYGGLFGGALAAAVFLRLRGLSVLSYADAVVPAVALGYAIGRVGCFLNGDDYGTVSHLPWAVQYPSGTEAYAAHLTLGWIDSADVLSLPIHPVQLYAALLGLVMFIILTTWRSSRPGSRLCLFAGLYGVGRFVMEWLRGDFRVVLGPLSLPQVFSLLLVLVAVVVSFGLHKVPKKSSSNYLATNEHEFSRGNS